MVGLFGDGLVEKVLDVLLDLALLLGGNTGGVLDSSVLEIRGDELLRDFLCETFEVFLGQLASEFVHDVFDVGRELELGQ